MPDPTMQQLALELRQLRNEVSILVRRFNAIEETVRQPLGPGVTERAGPLGPAPTPRPPADVGPTSDADYERAVALARGIITRPPGAGGQHD